MKPKEKESDPRWQRRKEARPDEIRKAALDCFAESGFAATRLDEIARRAGVTKGTLYLYFQSKEEIFKSVVREEVVRNIARVEAIAADGEHSSAEILREMFSFWARIFLKTRVGAVPKLILAEGGNFPEISRFYLEEVIERGFRLIGGVLRRGIERGEFRAVNVDDAVKCIIAPAIFSILWKHSLEPHGGAKLDIESLFQTHFELIIHGLARAPESK
ncbi:MAG: TetR/AcrR family transcriptional regulator [Acidobacteria bacterium]|nr:TetR/AcrR family transcriptional regulator [Acidobacteriota bacterium]